jgi:hypothetical protein
MSIDGAVEDHNLHMLVGFERGDVFLELRNHRPPKDIERLVVEGHSPELRRLLREAHLGSTCVFGQARTPRYSISGHDADPLPDRHRR